MKEFRITIGNRPGELARVTAPLARHGISIKALAASADAKQVTLRLVGHDAEELRNGLQAESIPFEEEEIMLLLLEDRAGEIANISSQLADAGVNITAIYLAGREDDLVEVVVATDDIKKAKKILSDATA